MKDLHPIDDMIRKRIESLPPPPMGGWDELAARLEEQKDDHAIAEKLVSLAPLPEAGSWNAFAEKLEAAESMSEQALDEAVVTGLKQANPPPASGWTLLANRLELIGKRREMVACLKITEAALLLSMLLLFARFGHVLDEHHPATIAEARISRQQFPLPTSPEAIPAAPIASEENVSRPAVTRENQQPPITPAITKPLPGPVSDGVVFLADAPKKIRVRPTTVGAFDHSIDPVPEKGTGVHRPLQLAGLFGSEPVRYYLNAFVSPVDFNEVVTQENGVLGITAQRKLSTGYSIGALLEAAQGVNALQFGLVYGLRSYVPAKILLIEEDTSGVEQELGIRYSRLTYQTISIPLNYQRELSSNEKWRVSAGVGMSMNVVLGSHVKLPPDVTLADLNRIIQGSIATKAPREKAQASEILDPTRGYFQGGGILENSSLYLSGNVRIERLLSDRWSIYFSPTFSKLVTVREGKGGKGPLEDRIHNTMLQMGARLRLTNN